MFFWLFYMQIHDFVSLRKLCVALQRSSVCLSVWAVAEAASRTPVTLAYDV